MTTLSPSLTQWIERQAFGSKSTLAPTQAPETETTAIPQEVAETMEQTSRFASLLRHTGACTMVGTMLALLLLIFALSGCSIARENMRFTYNPNVVGPGSTRATIEKELGSPDKTVRLEDGGTGYIYTTGRVSEDTKQHLIINHIGLDLFTAGAFELIDPFGISENETKIFLISYDPNNIATHVQMLCESESKNPTVTDFSRNPPHSEMCGDILRG